MDYFVSDPDSFNGVMATGFVGDCHGPFNAPTKTKSLGEADRYSPLLQLITIIAKALDQIALVSLLKAAGHLFCPAKPAAVITIRVM